MKASGKDGNSRPVYSSEFGRLCPDCGRPVASCICRTTAAPAAGDGVVRLRRETKGRGGKTVTVIWGVPTDEPGLRKLGTDLKQLCGTGGTVKEGIIEIQGDHGTVILDELKRRGFQVKKSGG